MLGVIRQGGFFFLSARLQYCVVWEASLIYGTRTRCVLYCRCVMSLLMGRKAFARLDWEAWCLEWSLLSLCLCLAAICCLIPANCTQHTLILVPVCLCTCLSAFYFSSCLLLLSLALSIPCSLSPSVVKGIQSIYQPPYFAFFSSCSSKREGAGQLTFPATLYTHAHIQKGIWYLSPAFLQLMKDVNIRGERNILSGTSEWPQGISALRGTD